MPYKVVSHGELTFTLHGQPHKLTSVVPTVPVAGEGGGMRRRLEAEEGLALNKEDQRGEGSGLSPLRMGSGCELSGRARGPD